MEFPVKKYILITAAALCSTYAAGTSAAPRYRKILDQYCVTCHNQRLQTGGLSLAGIDLDKIPAGAETWEKVVRKLRMGAMPPAGLPRPDQTTQHELVSWLETQLDTAAKANPN